MFPDLPLIKGDRERGIEKYDRLKEQKVRVWDDLSLWVPLSMDAFMQISNAKSLAAGFEYAPLEQSIDACLAWHTEQGDPNIAFGMGTEPIGLERSRKLEMQKLSCTCCIRIQRDKNAHANF